MTCSNRAFAVEQSSHAGVGVVAGQNKARFRLGAASLANPGVDSQLVVVRIGRNVVLQWSCSPLHSTQSVNIDISILHYWLNLATYLKVSK